MELGLVGGFALLAFLAAVGVGFARLAERGREDPASRAIAVGAGGTFSVWLLHTSVDWMHLIVGLTGVALLCAAALVVEPAAAGSDALERRGRRPLRLAAVIGLAVAATLATWDLARSALARHERTQGIEQLAGNPVGALEHSSDALAFQGDDIRAYYLRAAARARIDDYAGARRELAKAIQLEPHDWVTWGLLGDLELRHGDVAAAGRAYTRASRLNPQDGALRTDAQDPHAAAQRLGLRE
jgi:tetratricopeptide (TPR) repeat protein